MIERLKGTILSALPKHLLIDLYDVAAARALAAFEMVRDHAKLDAKRSKELIGQARFRMMEQGFQEVCELHGGRMLDGGMIPGSDLLVFQPFMRFESGDHGPRVILGLAAMAERRKVPTKNRSRAAGVTLNYELTPRLDFDGTGPKPGDIFVLFLVARDPHKAGRIDEVAIGVIDSGYQDFIFYESIEKFLAGYAPEDGGDGHEQPNSGAATKQLVRLKRNAKPYIPPEHEGEDNEDEDGSQGQR